MFLAYLATVCSAIAFLSGIIAVGEGSHFSFTVTDIFRGRRNALLYVWVTFSSIFSLAHCASLVTYGLQYDWMYRTYDTGRWMGIHSGVALLLISAHIFIRHNLRQSDSDGVSNTENFIWGNHHVLGT